MYCRLLALTFLYISIYYKDTVKERIIFGVIVEHDDICRRIRANKDDLREREIDCGLK